VIVDVTVKFTVSKVATRLIHSTLPSSAQSLYSSLSTVRALYSTLTQDRRNFSTGF